MRSEGATVKVILGGLLWEDALYIHIPYGASREAVQGAIARGLAAVGGAHGNPGARGSWVASAVFAWLLTWEAASRGAPPPEECSLSPKPLAGWAGADEWVVDVPGGRVGVREWDEAGRRLREAGRWSSFAAFQAHGLAPRGAKQNRAPARRRPRRP